MNKNILKYVQILLIFTTISLYTVEERNPMPFYYLMKKPLLLKLNLKSYKICRIKLNNVIENKKIEILDCYKIEKRISDSIKMIHEKNPKKK